MFERCDSWEVQKEAGEEGLFFFIVVGTLTHILPNQLICWYHKDIYKPQKLLEEETRSKFTNRHLILEKARARLFKCHIKCLSGKYFSVFTSFTLPLVSSGSLGTWLQSSWQCDNKRLWIACCWLGSNLEISYHKPSIQSLYYIKKVIKTHCVIFTVLHTQESHYLTLHLISRCCICSI